MKKSELKNSLALMRKPFEGLPQPYVPETEYFIPGATEGYVATRLKLGRPTSFGTVFHKHARCSYLQGAVASYMIVARAMPRCKLCNRESLEVKAKEVK